MGKMYMRTIGVAMAALTLLGFDAVAQTMIYNVDDLQAMQSNLAGDYMLANDIDASITSTWNSGAGFVAVGDETSPPGSSFTGTFNGAGHAITGLYINRPATDNVGLFGHADGATIQNVGLVSADVSGNSSVGGLVGAADINASIAGSHITGTVSGAGDSVGGLVGSAYGASITTCYSMGDVSGTGRYVGGLAGEVHNSTVATCYSMGIVSGTALGVGGLVGYAVATFGGTTVTNSYSTGATSGSSLVGGLLGGITEISGSVVLTSTYWDTQASGQATSAGAGVGASEGKTTAEMMVAPTFVGWDFTTVWGIFSGGSYPYLQAFPPALLPVSIDQAVAQNDPTGALLIRFDVLFDEPVTNFDAGDVAVAGTATGVCVALNGSASEYSIWVVEAATEGTIEVSIPAYACQAISDGTPNAPSTSTDNSVTYGMPTEVPIAWGSVAIAMLAAGVVAMRRRG